LQVPLPRVLWETSALVLNMNLLRLIHDDHVTVTALTSALDEMNRWGFEVNEHEIGYALQTGAERHALALQENPKSIEALERLATLVELARKLPFQVIFWQAQNIVFSLHKRVAHGDDAMPKTLVWSKAFERVCEDLGVKTRRT
jgi:hypothetical protein